MKEKLLAFPLGIARNIDIFLEKCYYEFTKFYIFTGG